MTNIQKRAQVVRRGVHSKNDIAAGSRAALARDDIYQAFAGEENKGKSGRKKSSQRSTRLKSRKTRQSKEKTPIR